MSFVCNKLRIYDEHRTIVDISFRIEHSLALIGESGSGKSLTLKALLDLLPSNLKKELDVKWEWPLKRGETLSLVPQNPFTSLSPLTKLKDQFLAPVKKAARMMELVGLQSAFLDRYPPQLSGGQIQRAVIAMALVFEPKLLLLDEPTTALDPLSKEKVLNLFASLQEKMGFLILFVTHDINSASKLCREASVIRKGHIVEEGSMEEILRTPKNEYTKQLIESNFANREFRK